MRVVIGKGSCGIAAGAEKIEDIFKNAGLGVSTTGCIGMCYNEPIVEVYDDDAGTRKTYVKVDADAAGEIVKTCIGGGGADGSAGKYEISRQDADLLAGQLRIALKNCGNINPESIDDYVKTGGYEAVKKCIEQYSPEDVINEIKASAIGGRGGAGFPTWFKWQAARSSPGEKKYVICNADEGDPGAFMDRALIEGDPHSVLEGMMIAAYAIGADEGVVYVRAEYPLAIVRLKKAIADAVEKGFLGKNIFGSSFSFNVWIKAGAGAFVCGEETALIASLEGERGMPRLKPPFPAQKGFWQKPSNINNVETFANIPWIILRGGAEFAKTGTENSKGTKVFALAGKIAKGGLVEIPMGMTLKDVIYGVGGGIKNGKAFKAVQLGGPSGGCIPNELIDTVIDYKSLAATGAIMGSGGMVVMDEETCMVDIARFFLDFTRKESCGKCTHCRIGTKRMLEILERIVDGRGRGGDVELLRSLAAQIKEGSLCALGQTAPNPVLTTLKYFENEYIDHIERKKCTAKQCKALVKYSVIAEKCTGCTLCGRKCPAKAIAGELKKPHTIDNALCTKCGICASLCKFAAITIE
ncbi:MAG: NADH-quinone oxidoreductase subunit NuoF [Spirochaetes bacterium]|nr:NADH-quinone oxidoreductase subunit NuoF [Spirochaetota bacterium]